MPAHPALTVSVRALVGSLSWHWVFYVNLPLGAVAPAVAARTLPAHHTGGAPHRLPGRDKPGSTTAERP
jgi:MFS family permease